MPNPNSASSNSKILAKATLRSRIKDHIQQQIADGVYRPGDRIIETQLARELNVSQSPVREALLELSISGLLEEVPYSGTYVRRLSPEDILDIYDSRAYIEKYAAERAATLITDEQLQELRDILTAMEACTDHDYSHYSMLDIQFHSIIFDAANSPSLKRVWTSVRMSDWTRLCIQVTQQPLEVLHEQHFTIYNYLRAHNPACAGSYVYLHIKTYGEAMSQYFRQQ